MQKQEDMGGSPGSDVRYVDASAVLFHHTHIKEGERFRTGCGFCSVGVEAILKRDHPLGVVQSDRVDQAGPTSPTSGVGTRADQTGEKGPQGVPGEGEPDPRDDRGSMVQSHWW